MENTERQRIKNIRKELPGNYAEILFKIYKQRKMKFSKSLIYKVAKGERINAIIADDLIKLAEHRIETIKRIEKIEKRTKKSGLKSIIKKLNIISK